MLGHGGEVVGVELGGWYPDPDGAPGTVRWWDGSGWTAHTAPAGSAQTRQPPQVAGPGWGQRLLRRLAPARFADHDWQGRPTGAATRPGEGAARHDDPVSATGMAPYQSPQPADPGAPVVIPYEDPAAGIYAARMGEPVGPARSPDDDQLPAYPPDVLSSGSGPGRGRWHELVHSSGFGFVLVAALVIGVVIVGLSLTDSGSAHNDPLPLASASPEQDNRPPLEQLCASTGPSHVDPGQPSSPAPTGPRIVDPDAHISYAAQGKPFRPWDRGPWTDMAGGLGEVFTTGQYFVTQADTPDRSPYLATILSGTVPATYGDDPHPNVECAARVVADDVRGSYYPQPNSLRYVAARELAVSGRPAYLLEFHLAFDESGFAAKGELVAICVIDVPGDNAAALYVSIPDTYRQFDRIITPLIQSIRVQ